MVSKRQLFNEIQELKKAQELQKSSLSNTVYNIDGILQYINAFQGNKNIFQPPTDPYEIYLTCGPIETVTTKICNLIARYSWTSKSSKLLTFLEKPNHNDSFTTIISETTRDLCIHEEAFWDISDNNINPLSPSFMIVEWDGPAKTRKYKQKDQNGNEHVILAENIVHFRMSPNTRELRGISKMRKIQFAINLYYYLNDGSNKKFNRNIIPFGVFIVDPETPQETMRSFQNKLMNNTNPNQIPILNTAMGRFIQLFKDDNFGTDFISLMDWFEKLVFTTWGLTDTDRGEISATKASAEVHQEQTMDSIIVPYLDRIEEYFNGSRLVDIYGGEFEWEKPTVETEIKDNKDEEKIMNIKEIKQ